MEEILKEILKVLKEINAKLDEKPKFQVKDGPQSPQPIRMGTMKVR